MGDHKNKCLQNMTKFASAIINNSFRQVQKEKKRKQKNKTNKQKQKQKKQLVITQKR